MTIRITTKTYRKKTIIGNILALICTVKIIPCSNLLIYLNYLINYRKLGKNQFE